MTRTVWAIAHGEKHAAGVGSGKAAEANAPPTWLTMRAVLSHSKGLAVGVGRERTQPGEEANARQNDSL